MARPIVLPEAYNGGSSWDEWICHFENIADINEWDDAQKLKFLKARLVGRAQRAFQHLADEVKEGYDTAKEALGNRFEPDSKRARYQAEFQSRRKRKAEGWADFAEDLRALADKAYAELEEGARDRLALNTYLDQLDQSQVRFGVMQRKPQTLDEAVAATLEIESYLLPSTKQSISSVDHEDDSVIAGVAACQEKFALIVEKLAERIDRLESSSSRQATTRQSHNEKIEPPRQYRQFRGNCWTCGQPGHMARHCFKKTSKGNEHVMQITPIGGFTVHGTMNGTPVEFLVDTGAAVTLVRDDVWRGTRKPDPPRAMSKWHGCRLLGVDGSPLKIQGQVKAELTLQGKTFVTEVVVAEELSAKAIMGLDFLTQIQAKIDLGNRKIILPNDQELPLNQNKTSTDMLNVCVALNENQQIPALSEKEVLACVKGGEMDGAKYWFFEASKKKLIYQ